MKVHYPLLAAALLATTSAQAQADRPAQIIRSEKGQPEFVQFARATAPPAAEAAAVLRSTFGLGAQSELRPARAAESDALGFRHQRYEQRYQGVPVEFAAVTTHERDGRIESVSGDAKSLADGALSVQPTLSAGRALASALAFVHAEKYMWQMPGEGRFAQESEGKASFKPTGELVIVDNVLTMNRARHGQPVLAWKFNVYATQPVSRAWIYVDARTGEVVHQNAIIHHAAATATFATAYSGTRSLANDQVSVTSYRLRETTRGLGIETYNALKGNSYTSAVDFTDADNNWTAAEYNNANFDNVAGDAHFGAQCTYDYWSAIHGRNSYDNAGAKIKSYVHFDDTPGDGVGFENAYWNGSVMTYGDGASTFKPLTAMDVCGHEIGHAVCEKTANLNYQNESGGMNEGFSDIWGACVEYYNASRFSLTGKSTWLIGEEIMKAGGALRSMSSPKTYGQPNTYKGTYWVASVATPTDANDYGGVHTNSGVLNYWFYLLSQGGSGTNDKSSAYTVAGVGIDHAAKIAFRAESVYMTASATFASCRTAAVQAATDLYGAGSADVIATTNAFYAVGVGAAYSTGGGSTYCTSNGTNVSYEYIKQVAIGTINRTSGADGGYYDGTALSTSAAQGSSQTITYATGYVGSAYAEYFNVWVDFNKNGVFTDAGEQIVTNRANGSSTTALSTTFTVPATATVGATRIRVSMSDTQGQTSCSTFTYGEVEDYTLNINGATATCGTPSGPTTASITSSGATLAWATVSGATSYNVQYKTSAASTFTTVSTASTSYALAGLAASTAYQWQVQSVCSGGSSVYTAVSSFTTSAAVVTPTYCVSKGTSVAYEYIDKVAIGAISRLSGTDAGYYNGTASSTSVGAGTSQTITVSAGFVSTAYTEYFRIYADWNNNGVFTDAGETLASSAGSTSAADQAFAFTVPAGALNGAHRLRVVMSDNTATNSCGTYSYGETEDYTLTVTGGTLVRSIATTVPTSTAVAYPNPATDVLHLTLSDGAAITQVVVYDLRGARVQNIRHDGQGTLDVSALPAGIYTATVQSEGAAPQHVRFVKE